MASALACVPPGGSRHPGRQASSSTWRIPCAVDRTWASCSMLRWCRRSPRAGN